MTEHILTPARLAEIAARGGAATPGPWQYDHVDGEVMTGTGIAVAEAHLTGADGEFIAHSREDVPALLARVAELEAEADRLAADRAHWRARYYEESRTYWDAELPPGGECCADCGQPVESEPCPDHHPTTVAARLRAQVADLTRQRDAARQTVTEQQDALSAAQPPARHTPARGAVWSRVHPDDLVDPPQLRWGLDDVLWGDDDSVVVLLSDEDLRPYVLELDEERAAALRGALAGPAGDQPSRAEVLREAAAELRGLQARHRAAGHHSHANGLTGGIHLLLALASADEAGEERGDEADDAPLLPAGPTPGEALRDAADEIVADCPDHGDDERATGYMSCHCDAADYLRRFADDADAGMPPQAPEGGGDRG